MAIDGEPDLNVVGHLAAPEKSLWRLDQRLKPDVVVAEVADPVLDLAAVSSACGRSVSVVALVDGWSADDVLAALRRGIRGLAVRADGLPMLVQTVRVVAGGRSFCTPSAIECVATELVRKVPVVDPDAAAKLTGLTRREREVLGLLARGKTPSAIAVLLSISDSTVKSHVSRLLDKLGLDDRAQAVILAMRAGLITEDPDLA
ncbi:helix-turn-helix domain-containing protein [Saccharopolyspora sp. NPDC003752]